MVRKGDFRASGSGDFDFIEPPRDLLDYASNLFSTFNEPYISLDLAISKEGIHLIEYQVLNFGPYTLKESPGYYWYDNEKLSWEFTQEKSDLNFCFGEALKEFIYARSNIL